MKTSEIIINLLSPEQIKNAMDLMEVEAQEKMLNIQEFYSHKIGEMTEDLDEILQNAKWENFLPEEYQTLKILLNEKRQAS
jgi:hypothetical protein